MANSAVVQTTVTHKQKQKKITFLACLIGGMVGAHKFYEEKYLTGLLYLITCGFCLIAVVIDLIKLIKMPAVYTVEKKSYRIDLNNLKDAIVNFPVDKVGKVVSIIGGGVVGFGGMMSFNLVIMLVGVLIALVGFVITWLKTRDFRGVLVDNGIPAGIAAVAVFAFLFLMGAVLLWLILKLVLGIDIYEWLVDVFGNDKKSKHDDFEYKEPQSFAFPDTLYDKQGNQYRLESTSGDHADYYCPATGNRRVVWESDLNSD